MNKVLGAAVVALTAGLGVNASAGTLKLDGYTSSLGSVTIEQAPVTPAGGSLPGTSGASGFNMTGQGDLAPLGSFVAWCVDLASYLMPVGATQDYDITPTPFSNSFGLTADAKARVSALFNANTGVDFSVTSNAAAFQMAVWEAAYEGAGNALDIDSGDIESTANATIRNNASMFLTNAENYLANGGTQTVTLTFLESKHTPKGQNLVTVSAVPVPAAGLLLLSGLAGAAAFGRRRKSA